MSQPRNCLIMLSTGYSDRNDDTIYTVKLWQLAINDTEIRGKSCRTKARFWDNIMFVLGQNQRGGYCL
jgi:hypothetical protein